MIVRRLAVLLLLAGCVQLEPSPASAQAAGVTVEQGWWWSLQPDPPVLPSPPTVPEDGLRVSSNPTGERSVAAVRLVVDRARADSVTLRVVSQRGLTEGALAAFPTSTMFEDGTRAGAGANAPAPAEAAAPLPVRVDVDAGTVTVDVLLLTGRAFLLQPAVVAGEVPRDLDVAFEPVRPDDVRVAAVGSPSSGITTLPPPAAPAQAAPEGQDGFVLSSGPVAAGAPALSGVPEQPVSPPSPAVAPPALLPDPLADARAVVPSAAVTEAVTRSRTLGLLGVGLAALLVLAQQARPRRTRLTLHGLPAAGATPPEFSSRARPPRLR